MSDSSVIEGKVKWRSPSNIALVKYWGKHGRQLPSNPSISFTLNNAFTETEIAFNYQENNVNSEFQFLFEGERTNHSEIK